MICRLLDGHHPSDVKMAYMDHINSEVYFEFLMAAQLVVTKSQLSEVESAPFCRDPSIGVNTKANEVEASY